MRKVKKWLLLLPILLYSYAATAQDRIVSGTILDESDNSPLIGVTITNATTNQRTKTNNVGYYSIKAEKGHLLIFTFVGYGKKEATVGDEKLVNIKMLMAEKDLENVVVTAYGIKKEKKLNASTTQEIKGEEIAATRRDNFINSLAGRVPGATVNSTSGAPGASTSIIIRGGTALSLTNQPLFVIDGVPLDNNVVNQDRDNLLTRNTASRTDDFSNRASDINPEDIESLTILKGPEAQALYGTDAANGAIIITTKRGKAGRATITYDNAFRIESFYRFHDIQRVYGRGNNGISVENQTSSVFAEGTTVGLSPSFFGGKYADTTKFFDNVRNFFNNGRSQQHNLSVEGGNDGMTYRVNFGYVNQKGAIPSTGYERISIRLSTDSKLSPKSKLSSTVNYIVTDNDKATLGQGGYYLTLLQWPVDNDVRNYINPDGSRKFLFSTTTATNFAREFDNPFWDVNKNETKDNTKRVLGNINFNHEFTKMLSLTAIASADFYKTTGFQVTHPFSRYGGSIGYFSKYNLSFRQLTGNVRGTIKKNIGDFRNSLIAGFYFEDNNREVDAVKGERFIEPNFASINNVDPITISGATQIQNTRKVRFYNQLQISWKDIIVPTFSYTYEGVSLLNSKIVDKNPFYSFGSASLAINLGEIAFIKNMRKIELLKLRVSYASSGQTAGLLPYNIDPRFNSATTTGGGYAYNVTGNNFELKPQFSKNLEVGVDFSILKRRITGEFVYYRNRTTDQIFFPRVSYGTGFVLKYYNGGTVQVKGMEASINFGIVRNSKFNWDLKVNYDQFRSKIISINVGPGGYYDSDTWVYGSLRGQASAGQSIWSLYGTTFAKNNQGKILINPATGLPVTTAALPSDLQNPQGYTFVYLGDRAPKFAMGILNTFSYKNLSVNFTLDIRKGGVVFNGTELALYRLGLSTRTLDREKPRIIEGVLRNGLENSANPTPNNIVIIPQFRNDYYNSTSTSSAGFVESDFVEEVNWLRMRDITFSYKFSGDLVKKLRIKSFSFYITITDPFIITNYSGADPTTSSNNASLGGIGGAAIDYGRVSTPRAFSTGIRVSF